MSQKKSREVLSSLNLEGAKLEVLREVGKRLAASLDAVRAVLGTKGVLR